MASILINGRPLNVSLSVVSRKKIKLPRKRKKAYMKLFGREAYQRELRVNRKLIERGWSMQQGSKFRGPAIQIRYHYSKRYM